MMAWPPRVPSQPAAIRQRDPAVTAHRDTVAKGNTMNRALNMPHAACLGALLALLTSVATHDVTAAPLNISDTPLFLTQSAEPLVMLALSNDEQLHHKAYTDFDDVDGDGLLDTTYKNNISYFGYFDPTKCYDYSGSESGGNFFPRAAATNHQCDGVSNGRWSGNFLNWAAMTRIDALRKVLYGGYRSTDGDTQTILERSYLPSDNHAWAKTYAASDLNKYTPYSESTGITLCNVTPPDGTNDASEVTTSSPRLRIAKGQWPDWAAQESKQCLWTSEFTPNKANPDASPTSKLAEFTVRVKVCDSTFSADANKEEKCKAYGSSLKPIGLLQDFADADKLKMRFGLITGSYAKRKSGGVLRKNIARFTDEVDANNGTFTNVDGIVKSINLMRISRYSYKQPGYSGSSPDNCPANQNSWTNGSCTNWGNPLGEIYLEALRYFVAGATPNFETNDTPWIAGLNKATWVNPYGAASTSPVGGGAPSCAKPSVIPISTGVVSFDNNEYDGSADLPGLSGAGGVNSQTDAVGASEGVNGKNWYVGSLTGGSAGDRCTSMTVNSLSAVTGICPESAGLQGSFKIAGLAAYAHQKTSSLQTVGGKKISPVDTFAVALAPPIPSIKVPVAGSIVTITPAGYQWRDDNAMSLINFRVITQASDGSSGTFFMNYENAPAGSDYDNDQKGILRYVVTDKTIKIIMYVTGSSAGATQDMGYIIDGVRDADTYYLVSNRATSPTNSGGGFFSATTTGIDTTCAANGFAADPTTVARESCIYAQADANDGTKPNRLMRGVRTHTVGTPTTNMLRSPLWYAAKWGGYKDKNDNGSPDAGEWDSKKAGEPDTYFPVTNAGTLGDQLSQVFNEIIERNASASSASVNSGSISTMSRIYQARFNSNNWTGELIAYSVNPVTGALDSVPKWTAGPSSGANAVPLPGPDSRHIITSNSDGSKIALRWSALDATRKLQLDDATVAPGDATLQEQRLDYLRGDATNEGVFRRRASKLGDIVNSSPVYVGAPEFNYRDTLESKPYSAYRQDNKARQPVLYVGANDGMLHAFNASTKDDGADVDANAGKELLAYIPGSVFPNLKYLTNLNYAHRYYVDGSPNLGDVFYSDDWHTVLVGGLNKGGKGIYALDVTDPSQFSEANAASLILWEFTSDKAAPYGDPDLGYTYSQPAIVRLSNGKWAAVFGNGYNNSGSGEAVLFVVDIQSGARIAKLSTKQGTTANPNGLSTPAAVDFNGDSIADYVFAGDLQGNMWKFDIRNTDPALWKAAFTNGSGNPAPLYRALDANSNPQPITGRPEVGRGPNGAGMIVLFGTGKFLENIDRTVTISPLSAQRPQTFYGIIDPNDGSVVSGRSMLTRQTVLYELAVTLEGQSLNLRITSDTPRGTAQGWYLDLAQPAWFTGDGSSGYQGERMVSNPILRNNRIIFSTLIPDPDPCAYGGNSWLMELDALTGARLSSTPFDLTRDRKFDGQDLIEVTLPDGSKMKVPASGIKSTEGITPEPGVLASPQAEFKYSAGTSGKISVTTENPGVNSYGRQSWRQIR